MVTDNIFTFLLKKGGLFKVERHLSTAILLAGVIRVERIFQDHILIRILILEVAILVIFFLRVLILLKVPKNVSLPSQRPVLLPNGRNLSELVVIVPHVLVDLEEEVGVWHKVHAVLEPIHLLFFLLLLRITVLGSVELGDHGISLSVLVLDRVLRVLVAGSHMDDFFL